MNNLSQIVTWSIVIYAVVVLLGGVMGYLKAKSKVSLFAGIGSGIGLIISWFIFRQEPLVGLGLATLIALLLVIVFIIRFFRTRSFMPSGLMTVFSIAATAVFVVGLLDSSGFLK
ncbi:MAG TPA: hypothetical protein DCE56_17335 [Cyanobacteria bacterium UBA8553]|nr:hypothetical protein [Cyanobacteria bacterium UBA8553]HAJ64606.1 hypothetical protein [Cyanobacteria bacterium UBA8543]